MGELMDLPGAAHLVLADGVVHLDPAEAVFEATLEGWARQQRTRFLNVDGTINPRLTLVRRFRVHRRLPVAVARRGCRGVRGLGPGASA